MHLPAVHPAKCRSTNGIERLNDEIRRCSNTAGIFPKEAAVERRVGIRLLEQSNEWVVQPSRHMPLEAISDAVTVRLSALPA